MGSGNGGVGRIIVPGVTLGTRCASKAGAVVVACGVTVVSSTTGSDCSPKLGENNLLFFNKMAAWLLTTWNAVGSETF